MNKNVHLFIMVLKRKNLSFAAKNELIKKLKKFNFSKAAFTKANLILQTTLNNILAEKFCSLSAEIGDQERKCQCFSP